MSVFCMARIRRLTLAELEKAEVHARRGDARSQQRRVRDVRPITWVRGAVDEDHLALFKRYKEHVQGAFIPKAKNKVLHLLVKFPEAVPVQAREDAERALAVAVKFATSIFGDQAVFAARMDRDEKSLTNADLFIAPRYLKKTKKMEKVAISLSRHLKMMAEKYAPLPNNRDVLRAQGQALQDEFATFLRTEGYQALRGQKKQTTKDDWISPEAYAATADRKIAHADRMVAAEYYEEIEGRLATREHDLAAQGERLVAGLEEARRVGEEMKSKCADEGRQMLVDAAAEAGAVRKAAQEDADKVRQDAVEQAERETQAMRDAAQVEAAAIRSAAKVEAHTLLARAKRRFGAARRLAQIMKSQFNRLVQEGVKAATKAREAELANAERRLDERRTRLGAAERGAAKKLVDAEQAMADVELAGRQVSLLGRALHDDALALKADDSPRGFRMNEASMDEAEKVTYRLSWSDRLREVAATVVRSVTKQRKDRHVAAIRAEARKRELDGRAADLDNRHDAIERVLPVAQRFLSDWRAVPEADRSPQILQTARTAGVLLQAAGLERAATTRGKGGSGGSGEDATNAKDFGADR